MTYKRGKRRKVLKILKKSRTDLVVIQPGETRAVGRYLKRQEEANDE